MPNKSTDEGIVVLSLFDGMSCGRMALERAGVKVKTYYASEIDKYAITIAQKNYADIIQLGCVKDVDPANLDRIDLVIGGSPCQGFSNAGDGLNFEDPRSKLFFDYVRILEAVRKINPGVKFMLENVKMKKAWSDIITEAMGVSPILINSAMGVSPILINSALVSAQNRQRYYWTNIRGVQQPEDRKIYLRDILQPEEEISKNHFLSDEKVSWLIAHSEKRNRNFRLREADGKANVINTRVQKNGADDNYVCAAMRGRNIVEGVRKDYKGAPTIQRLEINYEGKTNCLTTVQKDNLIIKIPERKIIYEDWKQSQDNRVHSIDGIAPALGSSAGSSAGSSKPKIRTEDLRVRRLTPVECERLQTVPDNYTAGVSDTQRYRMTGNGWTVDVIAHILSYYETEMILAEMY